MNRTLLRNGLLVDGSGAAPVPGDLLIVGDRIAAAGAFEPPGEALVLDCTGLVISPGFVDAHSHSDLQVVEGRREKIVQGVTTEVVGNCGFSAFPVPQDRSLLHEFANGIFCGGEDWGWTSAAGYLKEAARNSAVHVESLVGHGTLRIAQAGNRQGPLPRRSLDALAAKLRDSLESGACGFSSGLMYSPGSSAPPEELERLCRVVARAGKIYTTHMRDYADRLPEAVEEQIELARRTGCRLQISHLQAVGAKNWSKQRIALVKIEDARAEGIDVAFDVYPYVAGSTVLTQWLPQWALEGGTDRMLRRFRDRQERRRILSEIIASLAQDWSDLYISSVRTQANRYLIGQHLAAIAGQRGREPAEVVLDLLDEEYGAVNILEFNQSEPNLRELLTHPLAVVVSDGFYVKGRPHPRLYGTFPLWLGEMRRHRGYVSLAEAVRKITDLPARRFGIPQRGRLLPGFFADLVVFDADRIDSPASYQDPEAAPVGIRWVFREGQAAAEARPGQAPAPPTRGCARGERRPRRPSP